MGEFKQAPEEGTREQFSSSSKVKVMDWDNESRD
jgi:hypothetical protein